MGIQVEFNPDLALRDIGEFEKGNRKVEECIPKELVVGKKYPFLKFGQRNYWLEGELPLLETKGGGVLSNPLASIIIREATHVLIDGKPWTKGFYVVKEVFSDDIVHFNGYKKI